MRLEQGKPLKLRVADNADRNHGALPCPKPLVRTEVTTKNRCNEGASWLPIASIHELSCFVEITNGSVPMLLLHVSVLKLDIYTKHSKITQSTSG